MEKSLKARAVDLLSRREHSRRELERRLAPFAESEEQLAALLDELAASGWQSDSRFAEQFADVKGRKYGSRRIAQALREKGLDREAIHAALEQQDDEAVARALWQRKFGTPPASPQDRARQMRFLATRGFPMDVIRRVLQGAVDEDFPDVEE
ncbi:recombination regulator RecX [Pseudogulbenkiania sp. MAI-1]|uniref:recombination regulator RecX n=1 Tax=Pseudogulbenkiania sp. MAI-1 TaxID=990370 RepID=UPI00045E7A6B|nr:recombination regulator RecX [Pseudogulbenkiania sp. MAI-1]